MALDFVCHGRVYCSDESQISDFRCNCILVKRRSGFGIVRNHLENALLAAIKGGNTERTAQRWQG